MNRRKRELNERRKRHEAREAERLAEFCGYSRWADNFQTLWAETLVHMQEWIKTTVTLQDKYLQYLATRADRPSPTGWVKVMEEARQRCYFAETGGRMDASL